MLCEAVGANQDALNPPWAWRSNEWWPGWAHGVFWLPRCAWY